MSYFNIAIASAWIGAAWDRAACKAIREGRAFYWIETRRSSYSYAN